MIVLAAAPVSAGALGLLIVVVLGLALVVLVRSMNTQLKRVPKSFGEPGSGSEPAAETEPPEKA